MDQVICRLQTCYPSKIGMLSPIAGIIRRPPCDRFCFLKNSLLMHSSFFLLRLQDCKAASGCTGLQPYIVVHHYKLKAALIIQDSFFVSYSVFIFSAKDIALYGERRSRNTRSRHTNGYAYRVQRATTKRSYAEFSAIDIKVFFCYLV